MSLEKLVDSIPETFNRGIEPVSGREIISGFCLRYSNKSKLWLAGYGTHLNVEQKNFVGSGYSPLEAVDDFIKNCLKNYGPKKDVR